MLPQNWYEQEKLNEFRNEQFKKQERLGEFYNQNADNADVPRLNRVAKAAKLLKGILTRLFVKKEKSHPSR